MSFFRRSRKAKKSKSWSDLSSNRITSSLTSSQKSTVANALVTRGKQSNRVDPKITNTPKTSKPLPKPNSETCLAKLSVNGLSSASEDSLTLVDRTMPTKTGLGVGLVKSQSSADTYSLQRMAVLPIAGVKTKQTKELKRFKKVFSPLIGECSLYNCFSCVLYKESIAHGHLFVTANWICFYANLMRKPCTVIIDVRKITRISQGKTAKLIPNAIKINTENDTYVFSSFLSRDRAYKSLVNVWQKTEESGGGSEDLSDVESMTRLVSLVNYEMECTTPIAASESENSSGHSTPREPSIGCPEADEPIVFTAPAITKPCDCHKSMNPTIRTEATIECQQQLPSPCKDSSDSLAEPKGVFERIRQGFAQVASYCIDKSCIASRHLTLYNLIIFGTALLAVMTLYLSISVASMENEQTTSVITSLVRMHDTYSRDQMDVILKLNTQLLNQMSELLLVVKTMVKESRHKCDTIAD